MNLPKLLAAASVFCFLFVDGAAAQSWAPLTHAAPANMGPMLQLRDGRILVHEEQVGDSHRWWILTPDSAGSYLNGTWSQAASLPANYAPSYFASQVMLDGKHVLIEGGEFNLGVMTDTTLGAIYDVSADTWTPNSPPTGWFNIGDASSVILEDGRLLLSETLTRQSAYYSGPNSWIANGNILGSSNHESAYTLLHSGKVLLVDSYPNANCDGGFSTELLDPITNTWSCGAPTPSQLWDDSGNELGPAVLMYNGKVLQVGAVPATAIYDPDVNTWSAGPMPANGLHEADGPAALEPNGKVLLMMSPGKFQIGCQFMEYSPGSNSLANAPNPTNCPADSSYQGHLMILPTGEIMFADFSNRVELYTPAPGPAANNNRPTILGNGPIQHFTQSGLNNLLSGFRLNGVTQNNAYGDEYQGDTNYPLVRITNTTTGQVYWGTTHDESTHSIDPNAGAMTTLFDLPASLPRGPNYKVEVIANGLLSNFVIYN